MRALGAKGQDLRNEDGTWFTREQAELAAAKLNIEMQSQPRPLATPGKPPSWRKLKHPKVTDKNMRTGHVYFIILDDKVKIGFSLNPWTRIAGIMVALPVPPIMLAFPGTMRDEKMLHWQNRAFHLQGEWFQYTPVLKKRIMKLLQKTKQSSHAPQKSS
jgi:hypothetical protein